MLLKISLPNFCPDPLAADNLAQNPEPSKLSEFILHPTDTNPFAFGKVFVKESETEMFLKM